MKHLRTRMLIKEVANEYGITAAEAEDIINVHFEFLRNTMSNTVDRSKNYFPSVRLKNFAVFYCTEYKKKQFEKVNNGTISTKQLET